MLKQHMSDNNPNHELAEDLYNRLIASAVYAGSKLKKFPPAPYSPTIARLRNIQCLLKLAVTQHKTSRDMTENIAQTKAKLGDVGYTLPSTQTECVVALTRATRQLKAAISEEVQSKHLRQQHQNNLIQQHEATGNTKMAKKLRGMQRAEQTKRVFQKCKAARNPPPEGGLSHVLIPVNPNDNPRTCQNWRRIDDPDELKSVLQNRNQQHFGQSKNCALTSPPLDFTMKFSATCPVAEAILEGTYLSDECMRAPMRLNNDDSKEHTLDTISTTSTQLSDNPTRSHADTIHPPRVLVLDDTGESDMPDTAPHIPLHLQRTELPELTQLLIDSLQHASQPDAIRPTPSEEEYKGQLKA